MAQKSQIHDVELYETDGSLASYDLPSIRISHKEAPGYCVLLIRATDLDEGENAELRFSINLTANCSPLFAPSTRFAHGKESEVPEFRQFPPLTFRIDERTGKLLLVRRLTHKEIGTYCLRLVVEDQGRPALRSSQVSLPFSPPSSKKTGGRL